MCDEFGGSYIKVKIELHRVGNRFRVRVAVFDSSRFQRFSADSISQGHWPGEHLRIEFLGRRQVVSLEQEALQWMQEPYHKSLGQLVRTRFQSFDSWKLLADEEHSWLSTDRKFREKNQAKSTVPL